MMHEEKESTVDYGAVLRRRRWSLIVPTVLGLLVGGVLALLLPREYVATATLAVSSPSMGGGLANTTQSDQVERIRAISHELLSSPVVEQVAREEGLVRGDNLDQVVVDIRRRTEVRVPPRPLSTTRLEPDTFIVSYTGQTPELAQRVANRLTRVFVETHSKMRETRAEDTSAFLQRQLTLSRDKLTEAEDRLRDAKAAYQGRLPEQAIANVQTAASLRQQAEGDSQTLSTERERLTLIEQQIEDAKTDSAAAAAAAADAQSRERLAGLERQLTEARLQYTPRHPEVQRLEADLARARAEDAEVRQLSGVSSGSDPALRNLLADRDRTRLRIRELEATVRRTQGEVSRYQNLLNEAPAIEQRLMTLTQAVELQKQQYQKLAEQHQAAVLNEDLERRQAGERFVVLYSAQLPRRPASPNVMLIMSAAVIVGLVLGAALAMAREFLDRSVHDRRALESEFGRPVLAEIPHF